MRLEQALRSAVAAQQLRELDLHFGLYLARLAAGDRDPVLLAGALASAATGEGHVCIALADHAGATIFGSNLTAPPLDTWRAALRASGVVARDEESAPLVLDDADRLYLARYHRFERTIARHLLERAQAPLAAVDQPSLRAALDRHFPPAAPVPRKSAQLDLLLDPAPESDAIDHQRLAATVALLRPLAVVAGGPGTGKTTTVTRLLALLIESAWPRVPRIALAAPTGKAAARLSESIKAQKARLQCAPEIRAALPEEATTLHRLLKAIPGRAGFRHHAGNPLHLDVLVVDEVSMVDVPTMARLLDALPATARLILLGDPDQLASVEAGSVLGDICNQGASAGYSAPFRAAALALGAQTPALPAAPSPVADSRVILERSRRFGAESGIGHLARAINRGAEEEAQALLAEGRADLGWREMGEEEVPAAVAATARTFYREYLAAPDAAAALERFNRFRLLCALREGAFGVDEVNRLAEQGLRQAGLITGGERHYAGRPIMITRNDYSLGLFNGDVGVVWPDGEGRLRAFFAQPDGAMKRVLLTRLPDHETVFAMTIHKSQGSEFDRCVVLLPDRDAPLLTRELLYTGITRAREGVELWAARTALLAAIGRRITRRSGLREALWGPAAP
jgi:exodeoxyribonuclease V alpha subunit